MLEASLKQSPGMPSQPFRARPGPPGLVETSFPLFTIRISPAIKNAALDLVLTAQRRHTPSIYDPLRYRNAELHLENTGCDPNLRSLQFVPIFSVSSLGSTPSCRQIFPWLRALVCAGRTPHRPVRLQSGSVYRRIVISAVLGRRVRQLQLRRLGVILGRGVRVGMMEPS